VTSIARGATAGRAAFFLAFALFAGAGAAPAARAADDWREVHRRFEKLFSAPAPAVDRDKVLDDAIATGRADSAVLVLDAARVFEEEAEPLRLKLGDVHRRLEPLQQDVLLPAQHDEKEMLIKERDRLSIEVRNLEFSEDRVLKRLAATRSSEVVKALADQAVKHKAWICRAVAAQALGRIGAPEAQSALCRAAEDKEARVRMRAAESLAKLKSPESAKSLAKLLESDPDPIVKRTAVASFVEIGGADAVQALIGALSREHGTMLEDAHEALVRITRTDNGLVYAAWRDWWEKNKAGYLGDKESVLGKRPLPPRASAPGDPPMRYAGLDVRSDKIVFVIDISDSMRESSTSTFVPADGTPERSNVGRSKMDVAKNETKLAIKTMGPKEKFDIIVYNHNVTKWMDKMVFADEANKAAALDFIDKLQPSGGTNIFDSLEAAIHLGGFGATDRFYKSEVDAIILLSDGAPSAGRIQKLDEIRAEVRRLNDLQKIKIHAVALGKLADVPFLRSLAMENGGKFSQRD